MLLKDGPSNEYILCMMTEWNIIFSKNSYISELINSYSINLLFMQVSNVN